MKTYLKTHTTLKPVKYFTRILVKKILYSKKIHNFSQNLNTKKVLFLNLKPFFRNKKMKNKFVF